MVIMNSVLIPVLGEFTLSSWFYFGLGNVHIQVKFFLVTKRGWFIMCFSWKKKTDVRVSKYPKYQYKYHMFIEAILKVPKKLCWEANYYEKDQLKKLANIHLCKSLNQSFPYVFSMLFMLNFKSTYFEEHSQDSTSWKLSL